MPETRDLEAQYQAFPAYYTGVQLGAACERDGSAEADGEVEHQTQTQEPESSKVAKDLILPGKSLH